MIESKLRLREGKIEQVTKRGNYEKFERDSVYMKRIISIKTSWEHGFEWMNDCHSCLEWRRGGGKLDYLCIY